MPLKAAVRRRQLLLLLLRLVAKRWRNAKVQDDVASALAWRADDSRPLNAGRRSNGHLVVGRRARRNVVVVAVAAGAIIIADLSL